MDVEFVITFSLFNISFFVHFLIINLFYFLFAIKSCCIFVCTCVFVLVFLVSWSRFKTRHAFVFILVRKSCNLSWLLCPWQRRFDHWMVIIRLGTKISRQQLNLVKEYIICFWKVFDKHYVWQFKEIETSIANDKKLQSLVIEMLVVGKGFQMPKCWELKTFNHLTYGDQNGFRSPYIMWSKDV